MDGSLSYSGSIKYLCELYYQTFKKNAIILIDEIDTPFNEAHVNIIDPEVLKNTLDILNNFLE